MKAGLSGPGKVIIAGAQLLGVVLVFSFLGKTASPFFDRAVSARAMTAAVASSVTEPADNLLIFLDDLERQIRGIPEFLGFLAGATDEGFALSAKSASNVSEKAVNFGTHGVFDTPEAVVTVRTGSNQGSPPFVSVAGLSAPFSFKGGSYPGQGGSCGTTVNNGCTIVLVVKIGSDVGDIPPDGLAIKQKIRIKYKKGSAFGYSNEIGLTVKFLPPSDIIRDNVNFAERSVTDTVYFGQPSLPGSSVDQVLRLASKTQGVVRVDGLSKISEPFSVVKNDCEKYVGTPSVIDGCDIIFRYTPTKAGSEKTVFTVSYNNGLADKKIAFNLVGDGMSTLIPEKNLLIVYNAASPESVSLKDYYLTNRPGFSSANTFAISYPDSSCGTKCPGAMDDSVDLPEFSTLGTDARFAKNLAYFQKTIRDPIVAWIRAHPEKDIYHVVLMRGIPSRVFNGNWVAGEVGVSVQGYLISSLYDMDICTKNEYVFGSGYGMGHAVIKPAKCDHARTASPGAYFSPKAYPGTIALFTRLDMGSVDATKVYIDKLKNTYSRMQSPSIFISGLSAGVAGSTYYFEDSHGYKGSPEGLWRKEATQTANPGASVLYRAIDEPYITSAENVLGFFSWGYNGGRGGFYALDPASPTFVRFSGKSSWYVIQTAESFNGRRPESSWQGNVGLWFSRTAFGGSNYEYTPAAAVTHSEEPNLIGINSPEFFACWEKGRLFIDCAWSSARGEAATMVGDPWVRK